MLGVSNYNVMHSDKYWTSSAKQLEHRVMESEKDGEDIDGNYTLLPSGTW